MAAYSGATMGTTYNIKIAASESRMQPAMETQTAVDALLKAFNQSLSTYIPDAEIMRLNEAEAGKWLNVSPRFMAVLVLSRDTYRLSSGAFDPTIGPLVNLWGFGPGLKPNKVPSNEAIATAKEQVGLDFVEIDVVNQRIKKLKPVTIDFSAIAKGYAVDEVADYLRSQDYQDFMVEIGGELRISGRKASGELWRIGVESPSAGGTIRPIGVSGVGVATSGNYRNYFEENGVRYSHTIDPKTGKPVTHNLASITVIAETAAKADALATAYSVMGGDDAMRLAAKYDHAIYMIERSTGEAKEPFTVRHSTAFRPYLDAGE